VFNGSSFSARDFMLQIGHSRRLLDNLQLGINIKLAASFYEQYTSCGIGADLSMTYYNKDKMFGASIITQNIGSSVSTFYFSFDQHFPKLPFAMHIGCNKKLEHAPIRLHFVYHDLQCWNLSDVNIATTGDPNLIKDFSKDLFNHVVFASEFLFSENFQFRLGYDFLNRNSLRPQSRPATTGISWGVGIKIKKLAINYSNAKYHMSGTANNITILKKIGRSKEN